MAALTQGYLHLWYTHFDEQGSMGTLLQQRKKEIKERTVEKLKIAETTSHTTEKDFEQLYRIKPEDLDTQIEISSELNSAMKDLQDAVINFQSLIKEADTLKKKREVVNNAISIIDRILAQGANTGYTTEAAMDQIRTARKKMEEAKSYFYRWAAFNSKEGQNAIKEALKTMESGTAGYTFELADNLGFLTASKKGLSDIHDLYINIGGSTTFSDTLRKEGREDPEFEKELNMLANALDSNNGQLAKGDQILMYHSVDGQGNVTSETKYAVFQDKNYANIKSVSIMEKTFGQLGIEQEFGTNNIVNIAGGLAGSATGYARILAKHNVQRTGIGVPPPKGGPSQGEIDSYWTTIRESMRLLALSDAIAGDINANITMRPNYYVIRRKSDGEVRVIGVSTILNRIRNDLKNADKNSSMGVAWNFSNEFWTNTVRDKYWQYNIGNFITSERGMAAGYKRSALAYPWILKLINEQKVRISLNFSDYFS